MLDFLAQEEVRNSILTGEWWKNLVKKEAWELLSPAMKITISAILTLGLYSLLYRENKFYRLVEHIFVGLATGYSVYAIWTSVLEPHWWEQMVGKVAAEGQTMQMAYWVWAAALPVGFLAFFVFSEKYGWLSRIPIGIIIGLWAGQQLDAFIGRFLPQVADTAKPLFPNSMGLYDVSAPQGTLSISQAVNNVILLVTFIVVLTYFIYSFEHKNKALQKSAVAGRWLLMVGFGAIFGTTMMTRFVLFIDRAYFLIVEWMQFGELA